MIQSNLVEQDAAGRHAHGEGHDERASASRLPRLREREFHDDRRTRFQFQRNAHQSGVIEGACRYLVKDKMDRTGARWSLTGAEAVQRLRAIRASKDFDAYWVTNTSRYEDGQFPDPLPAPKPRLKRMK